MEVDLCSMVGGNIISQLAVYTTYIPLIYCLFGWLYATYHLLREPETTIDVLNYSSSMAYMDLVLIILMFGPFFRPGNMMRPNATQYTMGFLSSVQ